MATLTRRCRAEARCGTEALAWLTDVAGLPSDDAIPILRWSAQALLRSARDAGAPPRP